MKASSTVLRPHRKQAFTVRNCKDLLIRAMENALRVKTPVTKQEHCSLFTAVSTQIELLLLRGIQAHQLTQKSTISRSSQVRTPPLLILCSQFSSSCDFQRHSGLSELVFASWHSAAGSRDIPARCPGGQELPTVAALQGICSPQ